MVPSIGTGSSCSITALHESAFSLTVDCLGLKKEFLFTSNHSSKPVKKSTVLDVITKNATCPSDPKKIRSIFKKEDLQEATNAVKHVAEEHLTGSIVAVFDFKDEKKGYLPNEKVAASEVAMQSFLTSPWGPKGLAKEMHTLFNKTLGVDFMLCEGSLKMDILPSFTEEQISHLNTTGAQFFCGVTEYFMTAIKMGYEVKTPQTVLDNNHYFKPLKADLKNYVKSEKSVVLYPSSYKQMYSIESPYAKNMSQIFKVEGSCNEATEMTALTLEPQ